MEQIASLSTGLANWRSYVAICKPRIVALICFTAVVGMLLSTEGLVPWRPFLFGILGIALAASSAAQLRLPAAGSTHRLLLHRRGRREDRRWRLEHGWGAAAGLRQGSCTRCKRPLKKTRAPGTNWRSCSAS